MPRYKKETELSRWLSGLKPYVIIMVFDWGNAEIVVLGSSDENAIEKAKGTFPDAREIQIKSKYSRLIL